MEYIEVENDERSKGKRIDMVKDNDCCSSYHSFIRISPQLDMSLFLSHVTWSEPKSNAIRGDPLPNRSKENTDINIRERRRRKNFKKDYKDLTRAFDSSVVNFSGLLSGNSFGWAWMSIGGGTSMISFSRSSPASAVADGETIVVRIDDGEDDESVILKIPFIPPFPSSDFLLEFYERKR